MIEFELNGAAQSLDVEPSTPLLWVIRENLRMTGTKFGCGEGLCGACTLHIEGAPVRSCVLPVGAVAGKKITTIEGLASGVGRAVQRAWVEGNVPQCGYCQSGQIMSACALLAGNSAPSDADIDAAMSGVICRCGTYPRIRKAIHRAAAIRAQGDNGGAAA